MAKFFGVIGFAVDIVETAPDVYEEDPIVEKEYSGDIIRQSYRSVAATTTINDNLVINDQISIIADPYLSEHYPSIKYVRYKNANWKVTSVDDSNYPRLILSLGGGIQWKNA